MTDRTTKTALSLTVLGLAAALSTAPGQAQAQSLNTTSYVSNTGNDANSCTDVATACATFQKAVDKTAAGGQVTVLNAGNYGPFSINKAINVTNDGAGEASILVSTGLGIVINAGVGDAVSLRGLVIDGNGAATSGVQIVQAEAVHIQNSVIRNFEALGSFGIHFTPICNAQLFVSDTHIFNNGGDLKSAGILVLPVKSGSARVVLDRVHLDNNVTGIKVDGSQSAAGAGIHVAVRDSVISGGASHGVWSFRPTGGGTSTVVLVERTSLLNNAGAGVLADTFGVVQISNSVAEYNATGASAVNGGRVFTYQNNVIDNNIGEDLTPAAIVRIVK